MALRLLGNDRSNYPYAVARVQAKRGRLIPRPEYDKLLKMDVSEITRFIQDSEYKTEVDELASRFDGLQLLESALVINEERTDSQVRRLLEGEARQMVEAFLMRNVVEDIKTVLRGKNAGASRDEMLHEMLLEDLDTYNIFQNVLDEQVDSVAAVIEALRNQGPIAASWARVLAAVPDDASLSHYEDALDKAYYARVIDAAKKFSGKGGDAFRQFVRREIDSRNLHNAARWVMGGDDSDFSVHVIPGGLQLSISDTVQLAGCKDLDAFDEMVQGSNLPAEIKEAVSSSRSSGRPTEIALAIRHAFFESVDKLAHGNPLSILPILVFLVRKRQEVATLRAIARGKAAGLDEEKLQELVA